MKKFEEFYPLLKSTGVVSKKEETLETFLYLIAHYLEQILAERSQLIEGYNFHFATSDSPPDDDEEDEEECEPWDNDATGVMVTIPMAKWLRELLETEFAERVIQESEPAKILSEVFTTYLDHVEFYQIANAILGATEPLLFDLAQLANRELLTTTSLTSFSFLLDDSESNS